MPATKRHRDKPDPDARRLGQRVRQLRQRLDFSFDAFVEELGMGRGYLSELERGLVVPSLTALARLATALDTTVADLVLKGSLRERLFEVTKDLPDSTLRGLIDEALRQRTPQSSAPPGKKSARAQHAVPLFQMRPAAGAFSEPQQEGIEAWLDPGVPGGPRKGLFLVRITGRSMEPTIADGALCLCQRPWPMPQKGEVGIFVRHDAGDPPDAGRFAIKEYWPSEVERDGSRVVGGSLRPRNRAFAPVKANEASRERPFARLVRVVG